VTVNREKITLPGGAEVEVYLQLVNIERSDGRISLGCVTAERIILETNTNIPELSGKSGKFIFLEGAEVDFLKEQR
jgi:hypothetical protein